MFEASSTLATNYINGATTIDGWKAIRAEAVTVIEGCKREKSEVYANGPKVHGRREASRLDLLDVWEMKACAVFDNCSAQIAKLTKLNVA